MFPPLSSDVRRGMRATTPVMGAGPPWGASRPAGGSIGDRLGLGLVLVGDVELDRAHRLVREVLVAVDRAARDVDALARLEDARRLALDGERGLALLHRPPLVARMAMKLVS